MSSHRIPSRQKPPQTARVATATMMEYALIVVMMTVGIAVSIGPVGALVADRLSGPAQLLPGAAP